MRYNRLGRTGLYVSELCLGTMTFGGEGTGLWEKIGTLEQEPVDALLRRALDAGINFIDTADVYSQGHSEELLGQSLRNLGVKRSDVVIATKFHGATGEGPNDRGGSRGHIMDAVERSLERLQTDHIDLYQIHGYDTATPPEETLTRPRRSRQSRARPLCRLLELAGVADREGAGDFGASRLGALSRRRSPTTRSPVATSSARSCRCSSRRASACWSGARSPAACSPASSGPARPRPRMRAAQTSTSRRSTASGPAKCVEAMRTIGDAKGVSVARVALAWLLAKPYVTSVIIGAKRVDQLDDNIAAASLSLSAEEIATLDAVSALPTEYPGWMLMRQGQTRRPAAVGPDRD